MADGGRCKERGVDVMRVWRIVMTRNGKEKRVLKRLVAFKLPFVWTCKRKTQLKKREEGLDNLSFVKHFCKILFRMGS